MIGKPKYSEIAIDEDKSISRKHGGLEVPAAGQREGDAPYVLLTGAQICLLLRSCCLRSGVMDMHAGNCGTDVRVACCPWSAHDLPQASARQNATLGQMQHLRPAPASS